MKYNSKGRFESPNSSLRRSSSLPSSINSYCNPYAAATNNIQQHGGQPLPFTTHHSPPTLSSQYMEQFNNNYHQHLSIFNNPSNDNSRTTFTNSSTPTSFCHQPTSDFTGMQIPSNVQDFSHNAKIVSNDMMICQSDNFPQQHCNLGCQSGVTTSMNQAIPSHNPSLSNNYLHLTITPNFTAFRFVLSCLVLGYSYDTYSQLLLLNNIKPYSLSAFYNIFDKFAMAIELITSVDVAIKLKEAREKSPNGLTIMIDFGWGHKRDSSNGALVVIDATTSKIVYFKVLEKCPFCRDSCSITSCTSGLYHGNSKAMEGESVKRFCLDMKNKQTNISCIVHDEDSSTLKHVVDSFPNVISYLDTNHIRKNLYKSLMMPSGLFHYGDKTLLKKLAPKISTYLSQFIQRATTLDQLHGWIKNIPNHLCNKHDQCSDSCPFKKNPGCKRSNPKFKWLSEKDNDLILKYLREKLNNLVLKGKTIFHHYSSNPCESFHRMRIKYISKNVKGTKYFTTRTQQAVLDKNIGKTWIVWLFDLLHIPQEELWKRNVTKLNEKRNRVLNHHHTEEAKKQKANNKRKQKELFTQPSNSTATYGLSCDCTSGCNSTSCACKKHAMACTTGCSCINCTNTQIPSDEKPAKKKKIHHVGSETPTSRKKKCCCCCGEYFTKLEKCPYCSIEVCESCNGAPMCMCCVTNTQKEEEDRGRKKK